MPVFSASDMMLPYLFIISNFNFVFFLKIIKTSYGGSGSNVLLYYTDYKYFR